VKEEIQYGALLLLVNRGSQNKILLVKGIFNYSLLPDQCDHILEIVVLTEVKVKCSRHGEPGNPIAICAFCSAK
jgi:hypothetical protein